MRGSKLVSRHNQEKKGSQSHFLFIWLWEYFFLREVSVHKVEQSECSAGNQSQRRHALHTEEETTLHKGTADRSGTIYIFWRPHLKIIRGLINATLLRDFSYFHFIWWMGGEYSLDLNQAYRPRGLPSLNIFSQEGFLFGSLEETLCGVPRSETGYSGVLKRPNFSVDCSQKKVRAEEP